MLFRSAGNLIKHPCFNTMRECEKGYRVVGKLEHTDFVMNQSFWIGVYPEMTKQKMDYMLRMIRAFINQKR